MYKLRAATKYRRDVRRCNKRGLDMELLIQALDLLEEYGELPEQYGAHSLKGEYKGCLDAHLVSDWVLVYQVHKEDKIIDLKRTGTHQDVFRSY